MDKRKRSKVSYVARIAAFSLAGMIFAACLSGCYSLGEHASRSVGMYKGTRECSEGIAAVFGSHSCPAGGFKNAIAVMMLPFHMMDLPFEVIADTISFPCDFIEWALSDD